MTKSATVSSSRQSAVSVRRSSDTGARSDPAASLSRPISTRQVGQSSTWRPVAGSAAPRAYGIRDSGAGWVTRSLRSMALRIGLVIRTVGPGLLGHGSQVSPLDPRLLEAGTDRREGAIHVVVDCLGVGVAEGAGHLVGGHLVDHVQPDGEPVVWGERLQGCSEDLLLLGEPCRVGRGIRALGGGRDSERGGHPAMPGARRAVGSGELLEERPKSEVRAVAGAQQFVGLDVRLRGPRFWGVRTAALPRLR